MLKYFFISEIVFNIAYRFNHLKNNDMKKQTPILNQIVNGLNAIYEFAPTFWNWVIVLSSIYILLQK